MSSITLERGTFDKPYYDGLRITISARAPDGEDKPLIDGGAFNWLATLTSNRKLVLVASALGTQLVPARFARRAGNAAMDADASPVQGADARPRP